MYVLKFRNDSTLCSDEKYKLGNNKSLLSRQLERDYLHKTDLQSSTILSDASYDIKVFKKFSLSLEQSNVEYLHVVPFRPCAWGPFGIHFPLAFVLFRRSWPY